MSDQNNHVNANRGGEGAGVMGTLVSLIGIAGGAYFGWYLEGMLGAGVGALVGGVLGYVIGVMLIVVIQWAFAAIFMLAIIAGIIWVVNSLGYI